MRYFEIFLEIHKYIHDLPHDVDIHYLPVVKIVFLSDVSIE